MIEILLLLLWSILFSVSFYVFLMSLLGSFPKKKILNQAPLVTKFAIVIPAHNESRTITETLENLLTMDYPKKSFDIYVIADNCSDQTAEVSREGGVKSLERRDDQHKGKGHALKWFFEKGIKEHGSYDAFLIVDADSIVTPNILKAMNQRFLEGASALTSAYSIRNPDRSVPASIAYIGFLLRNLRYRGINRAGGSVPLLGNGMGFSWEIIKRYGWKATSITEDKEYWAILHKEGVKVEFVEEASVYGEIPETFKNFEIPRARWDLGEFEVFKEYGMPFLRHFLKRRDLPSLIAFFELLTPPFTVTFILIGMFFILLIFLTTEYYLIALGLINLLLLMLCLFLGYLKSEKKNKINIKIYFYLPFFIPWRLWNTMKRLLGQGRKEWIRTPRD